MYQGAIIDGAWDGFYEGKVGKFNSIFIRQNGHFVTGQLTMHKQPNGDDENKAFDFKGVFRDNNLIITFEPKSRDRLGGGSLCFALVEDAQKLKGQCLYISSLRREISVFNEYWVKNHKT